MRKLSEAFVNELNEVSLSVAEAAFVTDVPMRVIDHEIDARILRRAGRRDRAVSGGDLVYLRATREFRSGLTPALRKALRDEIVAATAGGRRVASLGTLSVALDDVADKLQADMRWIEKVKAELVESRPSVMGGEPVLTGTRLPVRLLAELARAGTSRDEIIDEFEVTQEQMDAAVTYDRIVPRRGRPRLNRRALTQHVPADR